MDPDRSDSRLLELAGSIASGTTVDWREVEQRAADKNEAQLLRSLHVVDQIARVHWEAPGEMDETGPSTKNDQNYDVQPQHWRHLTILEHVGQGAFGDVYRARDAALDWQVALKLLWTSHAPGSARVSHLLNEARLMAKLRHPNVVRVYGAEFVEGRVGLWMEFIKGRTLEDMLDSHVTFGDKEAAQIGHQLCRALAAVHGVGLVHRDIKARNVMREDGGRIVLMDFGGGADLRAESQGVPDTLAGTPLYLAPEIFEGGPASVSADIYSLGVLLFHLVTGSYPVEGHTRQDVERAHQGRERKYLRDLRPDLPEAFIRVVERAIEYEPKNRYRTAGEFEAALAEPARGSFVTEPGKANEVASNRSPRVMALAGAALLVAAAAVGAIWWNATRRGPGEVAAAGGDSTRGLAAQSTAPSPSTIEYLAGFQSFRGGRNVRLRQGAAVAPGDKLSLEFEASRPAFVYVVNQDEQGEAYLLFPLPGYSPTNPVPSGQSHRLPGRRNGEDIYWQVSSAGGREHFYVFASAERPIAFENLLSALPAPEIGKPVASVPLPRNALGVLRSVGGLATAEPAHQTAGFKPQFPPLPQLPEGRESVSGLWEREITFENPVK
jgi:eukaryotic-like serine/threonine-protein kinase